MNVISDLGFDCVVVDLTKNYFELFALPVSCQVDQQRLSSQYRALQRAVHPDRFAGGDDRQQRLSIQYASHVNEAFNTLKQPLSRAIYLLKLAGREVDMERNTIMDSGFLLQQMELREAVAEISSSSSPEQEVERLADQVNADLHRYLQQFEGFWKSGAEQDLDQAEALVRKMQFMVKLAAELEQLESGLLDD
ncbi:Fe-S protein assembly co-chaperone HscB [Endozoicomonas sp. SCSIO W0465]|uniref:Fe-S protein assembly co-chaperone HscB n=1 Tax=Endozoicomonas sp. SCSIO W0465 TaxID=2918516 RepID=UPI002074C48F|nr:Fe-S protein assembly co-chaperone HscB [Endozoicomonas sp. SCSIO W0465]USE39009.1 Fe-S protein assembly co-chaperone HscB [Endozoicomonas sp. SCSIO W0465]